MCVFSKLNYVIIYIYISIPVHRTPDASSLPFTFNSNLKHSFHTAVCCSCGLNSLYEHRERVCIDSYLDSALEKTNKQTNKNKNKQNPLPHRGIEPASVLRRSFRFDALTTQLSRPRGPRAGAGRQKQKSTWIRTDRLQSDGGSGWIKTNEQSGRVLVA